MAPQQCQNNHCGHSSSGSRGIGRGNRKRGAARFFKASMSATVATGLFCGLAEFFTTNAVQRKTDSVSVSLHSSETTGKESQPYPQLSSLPMARPVALPTVRRATLFPTVPFLMASTAPTILATLYEAPRIPIG